MKPCRPHYSGPLSRGFWLRIGRLPDAHHEAVYALVVVLQNLERSALAALANAELEAKQRKGKKP